MRDAHSLLVRLGVAVVIAAGGSLASGCSSTSSGPVPGPTSTVTPSSTPATVTATASASADVEDPGFVVPAGFGFTNGSAIDLKNHAGLRAAAPGAFVDQKTWHLSADEGSIAATLSRLTLSPEHTLLPTSVGAEAMLMAVAGAPFPDPGPYESFTSHGVRGVRAHAGWLDTFAWVDPRGGMVWVLTEGFDNHQDRWPVLVDALVAAQAA